MRYKLEDLFDIKVGAVSTRTLAEKTRNKNKDENEKKENTELSDAPMLRVITYDNICSDNLKLENIEYKKVLNSFYEKNEKNSQLKEGDIVLNLMYPYNRSMVITKELEGCIVSNFNAILRPKNKEEVDSYFVQAILSGKRFLDKENGKFYNCIKDNSKALAVVRTKDLGEIEIDLPSIEEQKRRAGIITDISRRKRILRDLLDAENAMSELFIEKMSYDYGMNDAFDSDGYSELKKERVKKFAGLVTEYQNEIKKWTGQ